jgi:hypothetical protein
MVQSGNNPEKHSEKDKSERENDKQAYLDMPKYWTVHTAKNGLTYYYNLKVIIFFILVELKYLGKA